MLSKSVYSIGYNNFFNCYKFFDVIYFLFIQANLFDLLIKSSYDLLICSLFVNLDLCEKFKQCY